MSPVVTARGERPQGFAVCPLKQLPIDKGECAVGDGRAILKQISERKNPDVYRHEHWEGSFTDYLDIVRQIPTVTRNAFQRLYDMVVTHGSFPIEGSKDNLVRYNFFDDPDNGGPRAHFRPSQPPFGGVQ